MIRAANLTQVTDYYKSNTVSKQNNTEKAKDVQPNAQKIKSSEDKLSSKAQKYLETLRKDNADFDFIAIALEKELDRQKERLEELKEKRAEEKKQEKKDVTVKRTTIQANSKEELLEKISELDWSKITEEKATQGMKFDITI